MSCISNCISCTVSTSCDVCANGYSLDVNRQCILLTNSCTDVNCLNCSTNNICQSCVAGYNLDANGLCVLIPNSCADPNCLTCLTPNNSQSCAIGYNVINGVCKAICGDSIVMP